MMCHSDSVIFISLHITIVNYNIMLQSYNDDVNTKQFLQRLGILPFEFCTGKQILWRD